MANTKNWKKLSLHALTVIFGSLILGFLALPYLTVNLMGKSVTTGYDLLKFDQPNPTSAQVFGAVAALLVVIFACVMIASGLLLILSDLGIISNEKVTRILKWTLFVSALLVLICSVLHLAACLNLATDTNQTFKLIYSVEPAKAGIANAILPLILGFGSMSFTTLSVRK